MTTTELRELDAWIAENVMGWRKTTHPRDFCSDSFLCNENADCLAWQWNDKGCNTWKPTTDPAAAMEVLKMCEPSSDVISLYCDNGYWVIYTSWVGAERECRVKEPTLELAICQFAKKLFTKD